jgi:small subunit ribosomal protein S14
MSMTDPIADFLPRVRNGITPGYTGCRRGAPARWVYMIVGVCANCVGPRAHNGYIPGLTKSSW